MTSDAIALAENKRHKDAVRDAKNAHARRLVAGGLSLAEAAREAGICPKRLRRHLATLATPFR